ncbi:MAG: sulfurtransferase-like selenium metabolism protein YedF [Caldisericaceae bacterium]|nr:sulfurtransferase-like selenium metabolism protein YedF [Caldisericaceae bacterium]
MTFLYLNSDKMGDGPDDLGKKLLKSFLTELLEADVKIDLIGCINSAVYLTTEGSEVIDILRKFEQKGTKIATCGTCLDYHGLRDKLLIGEIGSMKMAVELMIKADKVIRPN